MTILVEPRSRVTPENPVLRNTFMLLAMTLLWSAVTCIATSSLSISTPLLIGIAIVQFCILLFAIPATKNSGWGLFWVFAFTGLSGVTLAPAISSYTATENGQEMVLLSLIITTTITSTAAMYAMNTKKDFSFMGAGLLGALIGLVVLSLVNMFLQLPMLALGLSFGGAIIFSMLILYDVSRIVTGGETNYISATVSLYLDITNLFLQILHLLGFALGDD